MLWSSICLEDDRVEHHAIGTPVQASDNEGHSEIEPDRESVAREMESPTINDVSLEAEDVSEAPLLFGAAARAAMERFDDVDLESEFLDRACVLKSPPNFLRGMHRCAMRFALTEADRCRESGDQVGLTRAWKMFMLLPRILLHKPPRGGQIPKSRLKERFLDFSAGRWVDLLCQSRVCAEQAAVASRRRRRRSSDDVERRAERAHVLVQLGELSAGRQALEGASLAPGTDATYQALTNPLKRPPVPREPLSDDLFVRRGGRVHLDQDMFAKNLRVARRGAAGGPSGMMTDHLRPLLESVEDTTRFWRFSQDLARAEVPEEIVDAIRLGRLRALQKPNGGVRGIVSGDVVRRLVARTIAQQLTPAVQRATSPLQYALATKSGGECIAHALQTLTDLSDTATVLSIDGISAFDLISRGAMLEGLRSVPGGISVLPFVLQFCGNPSSCLWDDDHGTTHEIRQAEGGEQGDPSMPMLYALGQHQALLAVQSQLLPNERLMAFHDDVYAASEPERTCKLHNMLSQELWDHSRIQINAGKTQIWNRGGHVPTDHDVLLAAARCEDPEAHLWFGDLQVPAALRGIRVLGTPLGTSEFVQAQLQATVESHEVLLSRILVVPDLQSAFLLLLFCASSRATYYLRVGSLNGTTRRCGSVS